MAGWEGAKSTALSLIHITFFSNLDINIKLTEHFYQWDQGGKEQCKRPRDATSEEFGLSLLGTVICTSTSLLGDKGYF